MDNKVIVAAVQMQMRLYSDVGEFRAELNRFLRLAQAKKVRMIVFPELTALMAAAPLIGGVRAGLLRQADLSRRRDANFWTRTRSRLAASTAGLLRADFGQSLQSFLQESGKDGGLSGAELLWTAYQDVLSSLAKQYQITIVGGSGYLPGPGGALRHSATVFGPDGRTIGQASKVTLSPEEPSDVVPGDGWNVIDTDIGRIGLILGADATFPEVGRILAYQGAEILIVLGASPNEQRWQAILSGAQALCQQNQLYGLVSFLVGKNPLASEADQAYQGRSAILAPMALTYRSTGVMVQMGTPHVEGILTAEWDFDVLSDLWARSDPPVRRGMPAALMQMLLHELNPSRTLQQAWENLAPSPRRRSQVGGGQLALPAHVIDLEIAPPLALPSGTTSSASDSAEPAQMPSPSAPLPNTAPVLNNPVIESSTPKTQVLTTAELEEGKSEPVILAPMPPTQALSVSKEEPQIIEATPSSEIVTAVVESKADTPEAASAESTPTGEATIEPIYPPEAAPPEPKKRNWWSR